MDFGYNNSGGTTLMSSLYPETMEACCSRFTAAEGGARLAAAASARNTLATEYSSFIATRLVHEEAYKIRGCLYEGSQRSVYVTRPSRIQCVAYELKILTDLSVVEGMKYEDVYDWSAELDKKEVLVCTSAVIKKILEEGILTMVNINVLILDSCHLICKDANLQYIMKLYKECDDINKPRILALTYPLFASNKNKETSENNTNDNSESDSNILEDKSNEISNNNVSEDKETNSDKMESLKSESSDAESISTNIEKCDSNESNTIIVKSKSTNIEIIPISAENVSTNVKKSENNESSVINDKIVSIDIESKPTSTENESANVETSDNNSSKTIYEKSKSADIKSKPTNVENESTNVENSGSNESNGNNDKSISTDIGNKTSSPENESTSIEKSGSNESNTLKEKSKYTDVSESTDVKNESTSVEKSSDVETNLISEESKSNEDESKSTSKEERSKEVEYELSNKEEYNIGVYENSDNFNMYEKLEWKIENLESDLCCQMDLAEDIDSGKRLSSSFTKPKELIIEYGSRMGKERLPESYEELETFMRDTVNDVLAFIDEHRHDPTEIYGDELYEEFKNIPDPTIDPRNIFKQFLYVLDQLGPYAADKAAISLLTKLEKLKIKVPYERHFLLLCLCTTIFVKIRCYADLVFTRYDSDWDKIRLFCTPKVLRLAEILEKFKPPDVVEDNRNDSKKVDNAGRENAAETIDQNDKRGIVSSKVEDVSSEKVVNIVEKVECREGNDITDAVSEKIVDTSSSEKIDSLVGKTSDNNQDNRSHNHSKEANTGIFEEVKDNMNEICDFIHTEDRKIEDNNGNSDIDVVNTNDSEVKVSERITNTELQAQVTEGTELSKNVENNTQDTSLTEKMLKDIDECNFAALGDKIEDRVNTYEANLKDLDEFPVIEEELNKITTQQSTIEEYSEVTDISKETKTTDNASKEFTIEQELSAGSHDPIESKDVSTNIVSVTSSDIPMSINNLSITTSSPTAVITESEISALSNDSTTANIPTSSSVSTTSTNIPTSSDVPSIDTNIQVSSNAISTTSTAPDIPISSEVPSIATNNTTPSSVSSTTNILSSSVTPTTPTNNPTSSSVCPTTSSNVPTSKTPTNSPFQLKPTNPGEDLRPRRLGARTRGRGRGQRLAGRGQQGQLCPDALCGLVFTKEPLIAKILFMLIVDMSRFNPKLSYLCVQYCAVEQTSECKELKECQRQNRKQEDVLKKFRMHECNLLLATPALEEGIDLPRCNLVLRWDPPPSYRSYGLCRSRARAPRSTAALLCSDLPPCTNTLIHNLATYKELDQIISRKCCCGIQDEPPQSEEDEADPFTAIIKPYTPNERFINNNSNKDVKIAIKDKDFSVISEMEAKVDDVYANSTSKVDEDDAVNEKVSKIDDHRAIIESKVDKLSAVSEKDSKILDICAIDKQTDTGAIKPTISKVNDRKRENIIYDSKSDCGNNEDVTSAVKFDTGRIVSENESNIDDESAIDNVNDNYVSDQFSCKDSVYENRFNARNINQEADVNENPEKLNDKTPKTDDKNDQDDIKDYAKANEDTKMVFNNNSNINKPNNQDLISGITTENLINNSESNIFENDKKLCNAKNSELENPDSDARTDSKSVKVADKKVDKGDNDMDVVRDSGATVDFNSAIALINRYCGKLPSDTFTRLAPQWWMERVVLPVRGTGEMRTAYICTLRLPLNCPVKYNLVGHPMPTRVLARRMVALQACRILHKSGELDNHLMPIGKENFKAAELESASSGYSNEVSDMNDVARPGTTKRRQYYFKRTAWAFTDCQPIVDASDSEIAPTDGVDVPPQAKTEGGVKHGPKRNMLYALTSTLRCALPERYNTRGRRLHAPQYAQQAMGILMAREEPVDLQIPAFPVYTRSGEVRVSVEHVPDADVRLSPRRGRLIRRFMRFVFAEVLRVRRKGMKLQSEGSTHNNYYIVPTIKTFREDGTPKIDIDWSFLELIYQHTEEKKHSEIEKPILWHQDEEEEDGNIQDTVREKETGDKDKIIQNPLLKEGEVFLFDEQKYREAVVTPWYRNRDQPQFFLVAEICRNLTPDSAFPSATHSSFRDYYRSKYNAILTQSEQPLLDVDHTSARLNLLTPRYVNRKGVALPVSSERTRRAKRDRLDQKQILVPELCRVHPFAAPLWFATVALPCVLYRINALLIADEIRRAVAIDVGLGVPKVDEDSMPGFQWPPLDFGWSLAEVLNADSEKNEKKREEEESSRKEQKEKEVRDKDEKEKSQKEKDENTKEPKEKTINDILQEKVEAENSFEIGTWSNDMASSITQETEYDEFMEPLPPNLTFCTSASGGTNWCDPIEKPKSQFNPSRGYSIADSDCSYMSSDFDTDDSDLDSDVSDDETDTSGFCSSKNSNAAMGVRIEYKTAHEAEAVDLERKKINPAPQPDEADDELDRREYDAFIRSGQAPEEYIQKFRDAVSCHKQDIIDKGLLIKHDQSIDEILPDQPREAKLPKTIDKEKLDRLFPFSTESLIFENGQVTLESIEANKRTLLDGLKRRLSMDEVKRLNCFSMVDVDIDAPGYVNEKVANVGFDAKEVYMGFSKSADFKPYYTETKGSFDFDYQPTLEGHPGPSPSVILQALTMSNANDGINLERLETIGDSFLKFAITAYLYCAHPTVHEGKLSHMRSKQVSNLNLYRLGRNKRLGARMIASKFEPHDNWLPPCHKPPPTLHPRTNESQEHTQQASDLPQDGVGCFIPYNLITQHSIPDKSIADCVEALIGAYLLECGPRGALLFMSWLGIRVLPLHYVPLSEDHPYVRAYRERRDEKPPATPSPKRRRRLSSSSSDCSSTDDEGENSEKQELKAPPEEWGWQGRPVGSRRPVRGEGGGWMLPIYGELRAPPSPLLRYIEDPDGELEQMLSGYDALERTLQYRFNDRSLLLQALTHASHQRNRLTDCYQRLEFLGDAILDYLITRHLYEDPRRHSPGALTDLRSALVNNTIFATLAARHGFHKFFRHMSPGLNEVLTKYVKIQEENGHSISEEHYLIQEDEMEQAEDVEVPKALGDLFESVAGAIFLDSGMSLGAVWKSYVNLMGAELEAFSAAAPKSPVRELLEAEPDTAKFGKPERLADGRRVRVCVEVFGRGAFKGVGRNYRIAKGTAARCALRHLKIHKAR